MTAFLQFAMAVAFAGEGLPQLPNVPDAPLPVAGECLLAVGVTVGQRFPDSLLVNGTAACSFTAMPVSDVADLLALEAWGKSCRDHYELADAYFDYKTKALQAERDAWRARAEAAEAAQASWWRRPGVQRTIGGASVLATAAVFAYTVSALDR